MPNELQHERVVVTSGLTKDFGGEGVFDIDLSVPQGSIVGLIGPSGSGKTTTVRLLTGLLRPNHGKALVLGEEPAAFTSQTRARIGYMPQQAVLVPDLSLKENLEFTASLYGLPLRRKKRVADLLDFVELDTAVERLPNQVSGGEQRRAMLAATLLHDPDLVFLDEPTAGIDPVLRRKFWDRFRDLTGAGRTVLVTTQYVGEAPYCDYVAVLAHGRVLTVDTPDGLRRAAFGGDLIDVVFAERPDIGEIESLRGVATQASLEWIDARSVRLVVEDAGKAGPDIVGWARERDVGLERTEVYLPPFDDVFIELVSRVEGPTADVA